MLPPSPSQQSGGAQVSPPIMSHVTSPPYNGRQSLQPGDTEALSPPAGVIGAARDGCSRRVPAQHGQTPRQERSGRRRVIGSRRTGTPQRRRRPLSNMDQAAQNFLNSDESWRNFLVRQHEDNVEIQRQKLRVEERWQHLAEQAIVALTRVFEAKK